MKMLAAAITILSAVTMPLAHADESHHKPAAASSQAAGAALAEGEVRRVDKDAKKITIKHGPLANLDMPPMTMVFQVSDPAMLDQVKSGDTVRFAATAEGGKYTVTEIRSAK